MSEKQCSFLGNKKIENKEKIIDSLQKTLINLITEKGVTIFIFGNKGEFNDICYEIVTEMQSKYPFIKRVFYARKNEDVYLNEQKKETERLLKQLKINIKLQDYDKLVKIQKNFCTEKKSIIFRNKKMIDDSEYCIFYYGESNDKNEFKKFFSPHKQFKNEIKKAYEYAIKKNKTIFNFFH